MEQNYVGLQGKTFVVRLQSMRGSTGYGWCLSVLPPELVLVGIEELTEPNRRGVEHRFYFGVVSTQEAYAEIKFILAAPWKLNEPADTYTAKVQIIKNQSADFVPFYENVNKQTPFFANGDMTNANYKYGYPCQMAEITKDAPPYGFICGLQDARPYGYPYPFDTQEAALKYGYPCAMQEARPYGYPPPFDTQNAAIKYGYPGCC